MSRPRRRELVAEAARRTRQQLARLGGELRISRRRRRWTQARLGEIVGVVQSTITDMELGRGGTLSIDVWQRAFVAVDRQLLFDASRDPAQEPADAGHLRIQELILRLGRAASFKGTFELATRPADPSRSADVGLRSDRHRTLVLVECWNTIGDLGAGARSTTRKVAEAEVLARAVGGARPYAVRSVWVVRDSAANRRLLAPIPEIVGARFPGSSAAWLRALATGARPPDEPGIVWCDATVSRLVARRDRSAGRRP